MEIEFINRILGCMEQSNTAENCFRDQSLNIDKVLKEELDTEDVYEEFRNTHLIGFESAQKRVARIINPENNQKS